MNTANVPMDPTSSTPFPAENPSIPMIQECAASADMDQQDHGIQCSDLGSAQEFVSGIMRIVPTDFKVSFLSTAFIKSQLQFFVKQVTYFY